jgi:hypothetical protein
MKLKLTPFIYLSALTMCSAPVYAGPTAPGTAPAPPMPTPETNPLSFFGGKLVFDFQERLRFEARENNFDFNSGVDSLTDDSWLLERTRLGVKLAPLDWLTFYAQAQDTREFGSDRPNVIGSLGAEGDDTVDLRQAYVEIGDPKKFSLKVGRQVLSYGDQRLVGPLDWSNPSRTFDAVKLRYVDPGYTIDLFSASVVKLEDHKFNKSDWINSDSTRNQIFSGIYFTTNALDFQATELYAFQLHEEYATGDTDFFTLGTHLKGDPKKLGGVDYDVEAAVQFGDVKGKSLTAYAGHAGVGYNWLASSLKPRIGIEANYGSGDGNAKDGKVETFQNLFPTNHPFYGYMDTFSWQNMAEIAFTSSITPSATTKVSLDYHVLWLADTNDAWYRANGTTAVRPIKGDASNFAGSELDLTASWKATKNLSFLAGYSHFFAGGYLGDTGSKSDADFAYVQATLEF